MPPLACRLNNPVINLVTKNLLLILVDDQNFDFLETFSAKKIVTNFATALFRVHV